MAKLPYHRMVGTYERVPATSNSRSGIDTSRSKKTKVFRCIGEIIFEPAKKGLKQREAKIGMLVAIPSPRDIPEFKKAVDECLQPYDKVWFKYFHQASNPYNLIREYFLKRPRYSHIAILPDDLVINKQGVDKLIDNVVSDPQKYRVMMGTCLVDSTQWGRQFLAFTKNIPALNRSERTYEWYMVRNVVGKNLGILQAAHCGTPFAILSKDVMKLVSFDNDLKWNQNQMNNVGMAEDVVLSHDLDRLGIPIYVDTDVFFDHMKARKGVPM